MTTALEVLTQDIYALQPQFESLAQGSNIKFLREAEFALQIISKNDYLCKVAHANRQSLVNAVANLASLGLSLNPAKKQAYLVPRKRPGADITDICLDVSYIGLMDLACDEGAIQWAQAFLVREQDKFMRNGLDKAPDHQYNPFAKDRGPLVGVYVVVKLPSGDYMTHTMEIDEVYAIRDRSEAWKAFKSGKVKTCPWLTDEGEMVKKTCVKQAAKYWPEKSERLTNAIQHLNTDGGEGLTDINPPPSAKPAKAGISAERFQRALNAIAEGTYSADALRKGCTLSDEQEGHLQELLKQMAQTVEPKEETPPAPDMDADTAAFVADMDAAEGQK